jgi:hypothetical protein
VASRSYERAIHAPPRAVSAGGALSAPGAAGGRGWIDHPVTRQVAAEYLAPPARRNRYSWSSAAHWRARASRAFEGDDVVLVDSGSQSPGKCHHPRRAAAAVRRSNVSSTSATFRLASGKSAADFLGRTLPEVVLVDQTDLRGSSASSPACRQGVIGRERQQNHHAHPRTCDDHLADPEAAGDRAP